MLRALVNVLQSNASLCSDSDLAAFIAGFPEHIRLQSLLHHCQNRTRIDMPEVARCALQDAKNGDEISTDKHGVDDFESERKARCRKHLSSLHCNA